MRSLPKVLLQIKDKCKGKGSGQECPLHMSGGAPGRKADSSRRFPFLRKAKLGRNDKDCGLRQGLSVGG